MRTHRTTKPIHPVIATGVRLLTDSGCCSRRVVSRALVLLAALVLSNVARCQDPPAREPDRSENSTTEPSRSAEVGKTAAGDVVILLDRNGEPQTVRVYPTIEKLLNQAEQERNGEPVPDRPAAWLATLTAIGEVLPDQNNAQLSIELGFVIDVENRAFRFPLLMGEGNLQNQKYKGDGRVAFERTGADSSVVVWLSGKGTHQLTLQMLVPISRAAGGRRLQLSLPESVVSLLELTVAQPRVQLRNAGRGSLTTRRIDESKSEFTLTGLSNAIDVILQEVPERKQVRRELQTRTLIAAHVARDEISIRAVQTVTVVGGSVDSLEVTLPTGFNLLDVTPGPGTLPLFNYTETPPESDTGRTLVLIQPGESVNGTIELDWLLSRPLQEPGSSGDSTSLVPVPVQGFEVKGATRQDGYLGISAREGLRVTPQTTDQMQQIGVDSFQRLAGTRLARAGNGYRSAWRFQDEQFQMKLHRQRIEPGYQIRPEYQLHFGETAVSLTSSFNVNVYRASLESLHFDWPGYVEEGWRVQSLDDESVVNVEVAPAGEDGSQHVVLHFDQDLTRADGPQTVQVQFQRPPPPDGEASPLTLPTLIRESVQTRLHVSTETAIRCRLEPVSPTQSVLASTSPAAGDTDASPGKQPDTVYVVDAGPIRFQATRTTHEREISITTDSSVTVGDDILQIRQTLEYLVMYATLEQVRLMVPSNVVRPTFYLHGRSEEPEKLNPELGALAVPGTQQIRLPLPSGLIGQFQIVAEYSVTYQGPREDGEVAVVPVNLLQSSDATTTDSGRSRVEIRSPDNIRTRPDDDSWKPELATERSPAWVHDGLLWAFDLHLESTPDRAARSFTIRKAAIRTRMHDQVARSQAVYVIEGDLSFLRLTFPSTLRPLDGWWDGRPLTETEFQRGAGKNEYIIDAGRSSSGEHHILALQYESTQPVLLGFTNELTLEAPQFSADVWLAETLWDVVLPRDQHMMIYPATWSPRFHWVRQNVVWTRQPPQTNTSLTRWLSDEFPDEELSDGRLIPFPGFAESHYGNGYQFGSFGQSHTIRFRTMSQPAILLVGSGFALALGFILLRIPTTRHMLTFLSIGFAMTVLGLWHLEVVQLLIQPAFFGLLLASAAAWIESRVRRGQQASLVTLSSPSDFLPQGSSVESPKLLDQSVNEGSVA